MNSVLEEINKTGTVQRDSGGASIALHSAISSEEGVFLQDLIRRVDPEVTLEIGLAYGISALYICDALRLRDRTRHIAIDPNQHGGFWGDSWDGIGMANLRRAGFGDIVHLIEKPSHSGLAELEMAGQKLDFAFIDGWHTADFTLVDFFYVDRMLRVGGIVALDDADWPAVRKICRFIATNRAYSVAGVCGVDPVPSWKHRMARRIMRASPLASCCAPEILHADSELGIQGSCVAFRKEKNDERRWDHFVKF